MISDKFNNRKPLVYILLLNYNGWKDTVICLESIYKNSYDNYRIVVIDNDSPDNSMEKIIGWANGDDQNITGTNHELQKLYTPPVKKPVKYRYYNRNEYNKPSDPVNSGEIILIQTGENLGFAGGMNHGIRYALSKEADYVWILNNDTLIKSESLDEMLSLSQKFNNSIITGSVIYYANRINSIQAWGGGKIDFIKGFTKHLTVPGKVDYLTGASMLIPRKIIEKTGLFDEGFFMYWEDADYCMRAKKNGFGLEVAEKSIIYHKHNVSANREKRKSSNFGDIQTSRGVVRFFLKQKGFSGLIPVMNRILTGLFRRLKKRDFSQFILLPGVIIRSFINALFSGRDKKK